MRNSFRIFLVVLGILCVSVAIAQDRGRGVTRVGPEDAVGGITAEERDARQAALYSWLLEERPETCWIFLNRIAGFVNN